MAGVLCSNLIAYNVKRKCSPFCVCVFANTQSASFAILGKTSQVAEADGHIAGYIIGKVEGSGQKQLGIQ